MSPENSVRGVVTKRSVRESATEPAMRRGTLAARCTFRLRYERG